MCGDHREYLLILHTLTLSGLVCRTAAVKKFNTQRVFATLLRLAPTLNRLELEQLRRIDAVIFCDPNPEVEEIVLTSWGLRENVLVVRLISVVNKFATVRIMHAVPLLWLPCPSLVSPTGGATLDLHF